MALGATKDRQRFSVACNGGRANDLIGEVSKQNVREMRGNFCCAMFLCWMNNDVGEGEHN